MSKIDLRDVEFNIPIRIDHENRLENVELLVNYLLFHFDTNIVVTENSERSVLEHLPFIDDVFYNYQFSDKEIFHRTKILNDMAKDSNRFIIVNHDCDVLLPIESYVESANQIRNDLLDIVYPYDGRFMEVSRDFIPKIKENWDISWIKESDCNLLHPQSVGGVIFENREKYIGAGMENEKFVSWSYEDNERLSRFQKLGLRVGRTGGFLIHLFHFRGKNSGPNHEFYQNNMNEFFKVDAMSKTELENYVKSWG